MTAPRSKHKAGISKDGSVARAAAAPAVSSAHKASIPTQRGCAVVQGPTAAPPKATACSPVYTYQRTTHTQSADGRHVQSETRTVVVSKENLLSLMSGAVNALRNVAFLVASILATALGTQAYHSGSGPAATASEAGPARPYAAPAPHHRVPTASPVGTFIEIPPIA